MADTTYKCLLTDAGRALQAKAHSLGVKVVLDKFSTGDGGGVEPTPTGTETALIGENWQGEILSKKQDPDNRYIVTIKTTMPADIGGFFVREFGIWAQDIKDDGTVDIDTHILFAYGNHAAYYKALPVEGQSTVHDITVPMIISNMSDVSIQVVKSDYEPTNFLFPTGCILAFAGITTPDGWLWCNGDAVSRSVYAKLFNVIGTKYGSGDGSTTFNLPDFRERVPEGGRQLDDLRYIDAGLPTIAHTHTGTADATGAHTHAVSTDNAGTHAHSVSTATAGGHTHTRGTMNITGTHNGVESREKPLEFTGAFYDTGRNGSGSNGLDYDNAIVGFDASRSWTGETSNSGAHTHMGTAANAGAHSHTGTAANGGEHSHELSIAENTDTGVYGNSDTVQMAACTCNYMIKF